MYNSKVVVNPTTIETEQYHNPDRSKLKLRTDKVIIGWTGTHSTLKYVDEIIPVIQSLEQAYPVLLRIISDRKPQLKLSNVEFIKWKKETEIEDLLSFDIGIMPLSDDDWARGKCGFKALQYMALKIPCLASDVGVNSEIIQNGVNGYLCSSKEEWEAALVELIQNKGVRASLGEAGRRSVQERYSVTSNSSNFFSLTKL